MTEQEFNNNIAMLAIHTHEAAKYAEWVKGNIGKNYLRQIAVDIEIINKKVQRDYINGDAEAKEVYDNIGAIFYDVWEIMHNEPTKRQEFLLFLKAYVDGEIKVEV